MTIFINPILRNVQKRLLDEGIRDGEDNSGSRITFPMDVRADSDSFTITALLPGVNAEDLDIQIVDETITIAGDLKVNRDDGANYLLAERPGGRFQRTLTLPAQLEPDKVKALLEDGILTLNIPKAEEAKPRTIKVKSK